MPPIAHFVACLLVLMPGPSAQDAPAARLRSLQQELTLPNSLAPPEPNTVIRVGTCDFPPWSMEPIEPGGAWSGVAVHLLRETARELDLKVEMHSYTYSDLLTALEQGKIDVAATGIPITVTNLSRFAMTPAFDQSGLSIGTRTRPRLTVIGTLEHIANSQIMFWAGSLAGACLLFGALLWIVERKRNPPFEGPATRGLAEASWWSVVTMFTVGYGDRVPNTLRGKVVAVVWMGLSFILVTVASGLVTSALTVQQLRPVVASARDLSSAKVGCLKDSDGERFLQTARVRFTAFETYEEAITALEHSHLDAIVGSSVALNYLVTRSDDNSLMVLGDPLRSDYVGFGLRYDMPAALEKHFELEMLKVAQSDEFRGYRDTLLGRSAGSMR
jgi:ABC-type amino acid transport substrate-binding protein